MKKKNELVGTNIKELKKSIELNPNPSSQALNNGDDAKPYPTTRAFMTRETNENTNA